MKVDTEMEIESQSFLLSCNFARNLWREYMIDMVMFGGRIGVSDPQALDNHGAAFSLRQIVA